MSYHAVFRLLFALPLVALPACQESEAQVPAVPERPVITAQVAYELLVPSRSFVATVRPRIETDLGFRVPGKVARRLVSVGDRVTAGRPLATLDETDLRLQREQAEAERAAAAASFQQAQADLGRAQTLVRQGWATPVTLDRQQAVAEEARGRLTRAERALSLAQNALAYASLNADQTGVVMASLVEPGQVVAAGQPAIKVAHTAEKEAVVALPEMLVGQVRTGTAEVSLWSLGDRRYAATLRELSPVADPATRTYAARFTIRDAGDEVQFGMTATVTVTDPAERKVARLPLSALFNQGTGPAVWIIGVDGHPALRPVTVAGYEGRAVLIGAGLGEGDQVVTLGAQKLDPDQRVRVVEALRF